MYLNTCLSTFPVNGRAQTRERATMGPICDQRGLGGVTGRLDGEVAFTTIADHSRVVFLRGHSHQVRDYRTHQGSADLSEGTHGPGPTRHQVQVRINDLLNVILYTRLYMFNKLMLILSLSKSINW